MDATFPGPYAPSVVVSTKTGQVHSDDHAGLVRAIRSHFQGCTWQRCQTHFTRNILDATPKAVRKALLPRLRETFGALDVETARARLANVMEDFGAQAPKAMAVLEQGFDDATAVLALPPSLRQRIRTTNAVDRLNEEFRRRERVIRIFPNRASALRLMGALAMELNETWQSELRVFLNLAEYWEWRATAASPPHKGVVPLPVRG